MSNKILLLFLESYPRIDKWNTQNFKFNYDQIPYVALAVAIIAILVKWRWTLYQVRCLTVKAFFVLGNYNLRVFGKQRMTQLIRLLTNTSTLPTVLVTVFTIVLTFFFYKHPTLNNVGTDAFIKWGAATLLLLPVISIVVGRFAFNELPPKTYSDYSVSGISPSPAFTYISYCIWKECLFFEFHRNLYNDLLEINKNKEDIGSSKIRKRLLKKIRRFKKRYSRRYHKIKKVDFMIQQLGVSMKIPAHRLCDSLFHFSPEIYLYETQLMFERLKEIGSIIDITYTKSLDDVGTFTESEQIAYQNRLERLIRKVTSHYDMVKKRSAYQVSIIKYRDLHDILIDLGEDFGLTSSMSAYCHGIRLIMHELESRKKWSKWNDWLVKKYERVAQDKILFLYHKRRMHPGFDLHTLLRNFAAKDNSDGSSKFAKILEGISLKNVVHFIGEFSRLAPQVLDNYEVRKKEERANIKFRFLDFLHRMVKQNPTVKNLVIVTKGHSSVVNNTLNYLADAFCKVKNGEYNEAYDLDFFNNRGKLKSIMQKKVFIFLMYNEEELKNNRLYIRHLRYKFKENPNLTKSSDKEITVKIADLGWWYKNFASYESLNLLVSGAEFIKLCENEKLSPPYSDLNCSIINDEKITDFQKLDTEERKFSESFYFPKQVILAESYKVFTGDDMKNEIVSVAYNRSYSEQQTLYKEDKRTIITGS